MRKGLTTMDKNMLTSYCQTLQQFSIKTQVTGQFCLWFLIDFEKVTNFCRGLPIAVEVAIFQKRENVQH